MSDKPKTVRVRIAVAVNEHGHWNASGYFKWNKGEARETALEGLDEPGAETIHYVEADVPIPAPQTIEGTVTTEGAGT